MHCDALALRHHTIAAVEEASIGEPNRNVAALRFSNRHANVTFVEKRPFQRSRNATANRMQGPQFTLGVPSMKPYLALISWLSRFSTANCELDECPGMTCRSPNAAETPMIVASPYSLCSPNLNQRRFGLVSVMAVPPRDGQGLV